MGKKKSKDHYVSKTYLKPFLNKSNKVWVYDKKCLEVKERGRGEICWEGNGSNNPYFSQSRIVEEYLTVFENRWNDAFKVFSSENSVSLKEYGEAKYILAGYIAYLRFSTPAAIRAGSASLVPLLWSTIEVLNKQGKLLSPPTGYEFLLDEMYKCLHFKIDRKYSQALGIKAMIDTCLTFYSSPWFRIENPNDNPFVTSDNPTCVWRPNPNQLGMIYVPISPNTAILIKPLPELKGENKLDPDCEDSGIAKVEFVEEMNKLVIQSAEQHVISNIKSNEIAKLVSEFKDSQYVCTSHSLNTLTGSLVFNESGSAIQDF